MLSIFTANPVARSATLWTMLSLLTSLAMACSNQTLEAPPAGVSDYSSTSGPDALNGESTLARSGWRSLAVNDAERHFYLYVPTTLTFDSPVPLVLDFHGITENASRQMDTSGYRAVAEREGFLVAYPEGLDNAWNIGPCCTLDRKVDDVAFARTIHFLGAVQTVARWAELNGCTPATDVDAHGCSIHTECSSGSQVGLCTVHGGEHSPGDANVGWKFLSRYTLP